MVASAELIITPSHKSSQGNKQGRGQFSNPFFHFNHLSYMEVHNDSKPILSSMQVLDMVLNIPHT